MPDAGPTRMLCSAEAMMTIQSVKRALDILSLFTPNQPSLGVTEIARQMGLAKPTAHGLVQTLADEGFLSQCTESKKYTLGLRVYELGSYVSSHLRVNQIGGPAARRLSQQTGLMARIGIWDRGRVLVTLNVFPNDDPLPFVNLGPKVPAYCSAIGKAMLATFTSDALEGYLDQTLLEPMTPHTIVQRDTLFQELGRTRTEGVSRESEEYIVGLACIGAPLYDSSGRAEAAISVSGGPDLWSREDLTDIKTAVQRTAGEISFALGYAPMPGPMPG